MNEMVPVVVISAMGPVIGSAIGVLRAPGMRLMFNMLSFAAGVMLGISFTSLIPEAAQISSPGICAAGIGLGALVMYALDRAIPHIHPKHRPGQQLRDHAVNLHRLFFFRPARRFGRLGLVACAPTAPPNALSSFCHDQSCILLPNPLTRSTKRRHTPNPFKEKPVRNFQKKTFGNADRDESRRLDWECKGETGRIAGNSPGLGLMNPVS